MTVDLTFKDSERLKPLEVVRDYEKTIIKELDLKLEASNTNLTRKNFSGSKILYIPEVYWNLSTSKMLVLEEIEGIPCTDIDKIDAAGVDKKKLANFFLSTPAASILSISVQGIPSISSKTSILEVDKFQ